MGTIKTMCQEDISLCQGDGSFDTNFCVKRTVPLTQKQSGFSYIELIVGMSILLLTMSFFVVMFRYSTTSRIIAQEKTAMSTAAQNAAEVYKSTTTDPAIAVENEMHNEGFTDFSADTHITTANDPLAGLTAVTITIPPRSNNESVGDFVIKFYVMDQSIFR